MNFFLWGRNLVSVVRIRESLYQGPVIIYRGGRATIFSKSGWKKYDPSLQHDKKIMTLPQRRVKKIVTLPLSLFFIFI